MVSLQQAVAGGTSAGTTFAVMALQFVLRTGASLVFLHDWWVLVPEVVASLQEREDALGAVQLLKDELQAKQATVARLASEVGPAATGDRRLVALNATVHMLQDKLQLACGQYHMLKERNQSELDRLHLQRAAEFKAALTKFAKIQLQLHEACTAVWMGVVGQLAQQQET
eukprot:GHRR01031132.1.p2 GENE.GHRR01031132.1~~GHRR01031132.1.p2  ORF type:complete len:170 (+),score=69.57 GHRR01031132.1:1174-1683(+)